jgi:hypothetical protein
LWSAREPKSFYSKEDNDGNYGGQPCHERKQEHARIMAELEFTHERPLEAEALQAAIEGATAEAERAGGVTDVATIARQGFLDEELFHILQTHVF